MRSPTVFTPILEPHGRGRRAAWPALVVVAAASTFAGCRAAAPTDRVRFSGHVEATEVQIAPEVGGRLI